MSVHCKWMFLTAFAILALVATAGAQNKPKPSKACSAPKPEQQCTAQNTCGSPGTPCTVEVKRTGSSSEVKASTADKKGNALFCVKKGTTVTWQAPNKNTGFVVDLEPTFPFDKGEAIIGGSDRSVAVTAVKPGCYDYSAGACVSGAIYGMCQTVNGTMIVIE